MARRATRVKTLAPVRPNVGIEASYRRRMERLIDEMNNSLLYWISAQWRADEPLMVGAASDEMIIAQDAGPTVLLRRMMRKLAKRWLDRFDEAAPKLANYFAAEATKRADINLQQILNEAGMTVKFSMTPTVRDVLEGSIGENVSLIKSIAQENLSQVEGIVLRSAAAGRDLGMLSKELQERFGSTKKRAALIARDQNNKATAVITRARQIETGIQQARWLHSSAGKHPRPDHVAFSRGKLGGPFYDVQKGAFIDGEWIFPGQLINCRCVSQPVIAGFE